MKRTAVGVLLILNEQQCERSRRRLGKIVKATG